MNRRMMNLQSTIATRMEETPRTSAVFMGQCKERPQRGQVWTCGSQAETYCTHALPEVPRSYRNFAYSALACFRWGCRGRRLSRARGRCACCLDSILQSQCGEMLPLLLLLRHE